MNNKLIALIAILTLVAGMGVALMIKPGASVQPQYLQSYPKPRELTDFTLTDAKGQTFTKQQLKGRWTLAFTGYTFCPDICPTTLAELAQAYPNIEAITSEYPIQIVFISVDPGRDDQNRLNEYINFFNPAFKAATGEHAQLFPLVRSMGMMYAIAESTDNPNYLVDHSAAVVLINPKAQVIGRFAPDFKPGELAVSDSQQILTDLPVIVGNAS